MFKRFRILKIGNMYYPQWRYFFTWFYFYRELVGYDCYSCVVFDNEYNALEYINKVEYKIINVNKGGQSNTSFSLFSTGNIIQQNNKED